ncbi:MAG TPA: DNA replication and repair protein RecF [Longimicrobiales bacterium]|nr:DNA replication and repair protein RecF [Longimicrobiales bacterium]
MRLSELSLRHFRNLGSQELTIPTEGVALVGENAQGKSNFLEAIYYLETLRSFRGARDDQLVAFEEDVFRVVGTMEDARNPRVDAFHVAAAFQRRGRKKKVTLDGEEPPRLGDALGHLGAVIFSPADVAVVNDGPSERRRFLDIVLSLNATGYLEALQRYRHVLGQRNAALRDNQPEAVVRVWDPALVASGARVVEGRRRWLREREGIFCRYYREVSGGQRAGMEYRPGFSLDPGAADGEAVESAFREALRSTADREARTGTTVAGPHRDEVRLYLDGERELDVRDFGSGGQRRTVALALRLAEAATIKDSRGRHPVILLDDVFAELDAGRSERVLDLMDREEPGQVILTAPKESDVRFRRESLPRWRIACGRIEA